jgi:translation elongation factor EF-G
VTSERPESESDLAIFAINPSAGIDQLTIDNWLALDEFQIPRLVVVNGLEGQELDFEDAVMVANRVFDILVTPYLVLHDDEGQPAALISLKDLQISDYSTNPMSSRQSDPEHEELVREFRGEYLEQMTEMEDGAFATGILFPAIPINLSTGLGVDKVETYIAQLPSGG